MQRGYEQIGLVNRARAGGRVAKDDCLCGVQDEEHKQVTYMRRKLLFTIFKYVFLVQRSSSF